MSKKIAIVGAGAIGGYIGARLALAKNATVTAVARGQTLNALNTYGWRLKVDGQVLSAPCIASDQASDLGVQDLVIIAVKGPALPSLAAQLQPLIGPKTLIMAAMNGVPWWFLNELAITADNKAIIASLDRSPLQSVDPDGVVSLALPAENTLGCVVHASTFTPEPGLVEVKMGNGLILGDSISAYGSQRVEPFAALLAQAGFSVTTSLQIRYDIWYKLWGNMTVNPISAIAGVTADKVLDDPLVNELCAQCMGEAAQIGAALGCPINQTARDRNQITRKLGAFKTSMLQDVEAGRPIELDSLIGVARELGQRVGIATPYLNALYGITKLFAVQKGLYTEPTNLANPS
jgi:2-dehydropantoate 2-reductase